MKPLLLSIVLLLHTALFAQQLQQRDSNAVDLDSIDIDTYYTQEGVSFDESPKFKGKHSDFNAYIKMHLVYPEQAKNKRIDGVVYVSYVIDVDGKIKDVKIVQSSNPALDKAAIDVIAQAPKWKPARIKGKPVPYKKMSRVIFILKGCC